MKHLLFSLLVILSTSILFSQQITPPRLLTRERYKQTTDEQDARAALQYINHINHIIAKLENFDDILILQQEYENLTDNNLNLEVIKDEPTVQVITQLLTFIKNMEKDHLKRLHAAQILEQEKRNAIYKAIPSPAAFFAPNPSALAFAIGTAGLTAIQNYYSAKASTTQEFNGKISGSKDTRLEYLHELNNELFFSQWRLIQHYKIPDAKRVTRNENELFLGFAKVLEKKTKNQSPAETTRNDELVWEIFRNNEADMRELPFYWVTRATTVNNLIIYDTIRNGDDRIKDLHYSCEQYFRLFKDAPIIRKDPTACSMALLYVASFQKPTSENERKATKAWLNFVEDTVRIPAWQTKFALAQLYKTKLDDIESAKRILRKAFLEVHACLVIWNRTGENIFYTASSFEKATNLSEKDKKIRKDRMSLLLPIDGWFWLKGALAGLGAEPEEEFPLSGDSSPIERDLLKKKPENKLWLERLVNVTPKNSSYVFEVRREDLALTHIQSAQGSSTELPEESRQYEWDYDNNTSPKTFAVYLKTKHGFSLIYSYRTSPTNPPQLQEIRLITPWSQEKADCRVLFRKDNTQSCVREDYPND